jgi:cytochrome c-type biogenesis protein CcmH
MTFAYSPLQKRQPVADRGNIRLPLLLTLVLVLGSIIVYAAVSSADTESAHESTDLTATWPSVQDSPEKDKAADSVSSLLTGLEQRLQNEPNDGKGWLLLAKSYDHLGRTEDAKAAYERAATLGISDDDFERGLAGTDEIDKSGLGIRGRVSISSKIAAEVQPDDVVFVIASSSDGDSMPLAVVRRPAGDLPFEFVLDESTLMVKDAGAASSGPLNLRVKLSRSGDALRPIAGIGAAVNKIYADDDGTVDLVISRTE